MRISYKKKNYGKYFNLYPTWYHFMEIVPVTGLFITNFMGMVPGTELLITNVMEMVPGTGLLITI